MSNYFSGIFGSSPVAPLQAHMDKCYRCAKELIPFFEAVTQKDWDRVQQSRDKISELENEADDLKQEIRGQLPKSLFMPVPREDLLQLLLVQDRIANRARDVSGLIIGRNMELPDQLAQPFLDYVACTVKAVRQARRSVRELDELFETGFRGAEVDLVESLISKLDRLESETDSMQANVRGVLFGLEDDLPPVHVMFLYKVIELTGDIGDYAERVGRRLELLLSH